MNLYKFTSRKFLLAFGSALFVILNEGLGLGIDKTVYDYLWKVVIAYIAAEGTADVVRARK